MRKTESDMEAALDMPRMRVVPAPAEAPAEDDPSDAVLLARVAKLDRDAFEVLYHRYVRSIFGLALRRLRDRAQAEEVTQDAFAAVWRSADSYRPERRLRRRVAVHRRAQRDRGPPPAERPGQHLVRAPRAPVARWRARRAGRAVVHGVARSPRARGSEPERARSDRARLLEWTVPERGGDMLASRWAP